MSSHHLNNDELSMRHALRLAAQGEGFVEPNPMVGAVIQHHGEVIGEGFHRKFGGPHAEINAIADCHADTRGSTLFVTLEPCCHFGKTPPCVDAILKAGIRRVVVAVEDPFPAVKGKGIAALRAAGIEVDVGVLADEANYLLAPYLKRIRTGKPWVIAKWAMTLDGKIAAHDGTSKWTSSEASRAVVHQLRGRVDGIVVGSGTVIADNPALTARPPGPRSATRIVLDRSMKSPEDSEVFQSARQIPTLLITKDMSTADSQKRYRELGVRIVELKSSESNDQIHELLSQLGALNMTNLLVEGGAGLLGAFLDAEAIDEVHVFVAPKLVGGVAAPSPIAGFGRAPISKALNLEGRQVTTHGCDIHITGRVAKQE
jgi:diaminohydroxyphosphoribosylaminopyrimidine deaminase/5-amino-6-(5-phosphoribosylamino)uracil reductase